jgi:WD40 repeat protein/DNA-binding SARP family transcriptional activator
VNVVAGEELEVILLGPVEVRRDASAVQLGGPRQRALLAVLALHANHVVATEQLTSELFGVDAPETSVNALQVAVSRLRRLLGEGVIETRQGGYLLHLPPSRLDTACFERLVAEGRTLLADGDPVTAAAVLRQALALFHGPPLADLASFEFAQAEGRRLDEVRTSALMDRVEADLAIGVSADLVPELEQLIREQPLQERLRGQLMLALYRAGRQAEALDVYRDTRRLLHEELGLEPGRQLQELERAILRHDRALEQREAPAPTAAASGVVVCPFKGLASYGAGDAPYFFGRERAVDELVAHLAGASFLGLVGPSGIGKSSLVAAGLLPALAAGALPGSSEWPQYILRPGVAATFDPPAVPAPGARMVLVVDQLEELFTSSVDDDTRAAFLAAAAASALDPAGRFVVIVVLRADFYGHCAAYEEFAGLLSANHVLLGPMKRDELARAIERPAAQAGLRVERPLVDALVADVEGQPGALPMLSTSLLELWRERDGRLLTLASYRLSGGLDGAVARLAEQAYAKLEPAEQTVARELFLRLATEEDGHVARRPVPLDELDLDADAAQARVVAVLTDARLLTASDAMIEISHEALLSEWPRLRDWLAEDRDGRRLHAHLAAAAREWNARGRDDADLYRGPRLSSSLEWAAGRAGGPNALEREFLDESRLAGQREALRQRRQNRRLRVLLVGVVCLLVVALAAGGIALVSRSHAQREASVALARQLGAEAVSAPRIDQAMLLATEAVRLNRSTQTEGTLLATLLRSPDVVGTITSPINSRPQTVAVSPDGRTLAVSDNVGYVRFYDTASLALRKSVFGLGATNPVAYLPDGSRFVAFTGPSPGIGVLDAHSYRRVLSLAPDARWVNGPVGDAAPLLVSPDGGTLYYAYDAANPDGSDGRTYLDRWDLQTGRLLSSGALPVSGAVDGGLIAGGRELALSLPRAVAVIDLRSLRVVRTVDLTSASPIVGSAVSADGRTVAYGAADGVVSFLDVATGRVLSESGGTAAIARVRFSPDGSRVATTSEDGTVVVWDPASGQAMARLTGHEGNVHGLAFASDGATLFTSSLDGAVFEWAVGTAHRFGVPFAVPPPPAPADYGSGAVPPMAVSSALPIAAVASGTDDVRLLDLRSGGAAAIIRAPVAQVTSLAFSPRAPVLAITGPDGRVQLWGVAGTPHLNRSLAGLGSINGSPEEATAVAFSADGRLVVAGDVNHTPGATPYRFGSVVVWDAATGRLLWRARNRSGWVHAVAFSPDGSLVAAAQEVGGVRIYDARSGRLERTIALYGGAELDWSYDTLAFAPDGTLATGTWTGILQRWNPRTGAAIGGPNLVAAAPVASISFGPNGLMATAGGIDGMAKLWTTTGGLQQFGADLPASPGTWGNASFSPDGTRLVVVSADGRGVIWPAGVGAWMAHACAVAHRSFSREEWARYVGNRPYARTC